MCGIAGIFFFKPCLFPRERAEHIANALKHRGPDEQGIFLDSNVLLAHRRLKIIDLSRAAAQPMTDEGQRYRIMFNGEIYNFRELRRDLEQRHRFFSNSDTEVMLRLFQEQREKSWDSLRGMFAVALYDSLTSELFLVRDPVGIKPIYCYQDENVFIFASELKALRASGLAELEIDRDSIAMYLQWGYFPKRATPYKRVTKLLPGERARIDHSGVTYDRYWNLRSLTGSIVAPASPADTLDSLLQRSVEGHMISDVPLGAFLSGGIDSSLLVALMSRKAEMPVKTFTIGFSRMGYYDERPAAAAIAQEFRTEHHEFVVDKGVAELVPQLAGIFDEPFADSSAVPTLCLAQLARQHVTVALSGTGGDEVFGGYRKYMASYWMQWYAALPATIRSGIKKTTSLLPASRQSLWRERALLLQRFTSLPPEERPEVQMNQIFSSADVQKMVGHPFPATVLPFLPVAGTAAENLMLFDCEIYLPDDLLVKEDRCTMRFGLEARVPFLDRDLIEFMASLPIQHKVTGTATKRLFKKVAARYLPDRVLRRPKHGFGSPVAEWLRGDLEPIARESLLHANAYIAGNEVRHKLEEHIAGKADHSRQLWALLMLELWYQNVRDSAA